MIKLILFPKINTMRAFDFSSFLFSLSTLLSFFLRIFWQRAPICISSRITCRVYCVFYLGQARTTCLNPWLRRVHRTEKEKSSKRGNIVFERKDGERVNLESRDVARNGLRGGTDECRDTTWEYMYIERKRKGEKRRRDSMRSKDQELSYTDNRRHKSNKRSK